jgi:Ni,Fe-hydrogenase maturation factor
LKSIEAITTKVPNELYDKFFKLSSSEFTDTSATDLFDKLITGDYVDIDSKRDFIKVFTGKSINKKIIWKKHLGDLKSLIKYLIEYNLLKSSKNKWLTTASIFTLTDNVDFTNKQIAETKITKNDYTISKLLDSLKIHSKS